MIHVFMAIAIVLFVGYCAILSINYERVFKAPVKLIQVDDEYYQIYGRTIR